jgi:hypothetical protein
MFVYTQFDVTSVLNYVSVRVTDSVIQNNKYYIPRYPFMILVHDWTP